MLQTGQPVLDGIGLSDPAVSKQLGLCLLSSVERAGGLIKGSHQMTAIPFQVSLGDVDAVGL